MIGNSPGHVKERKVDGNGIFLMDHFVSRNGFNSQISIPDINQASFPFVDTEKTGVVYWALLGEGL